jgi:predicted transcriptional regulator
VGGFFDAQEAPKLTTPTPTPNAMPGAAPAQPVTEGAPQTVGLGGSQKEPEVQKAAASAPQPDNRPPWEKSGEEFDPQRAWDLIQNKNKDLADLKAKTDPIVSEWEQLRRASQSDLDRATEDLGKANATAETWRTQAIRAKAEALAAGRFVDTETALALIGDVSGYATADGIDTAALTARLDQLAVDKPFLVAAPPQPPGFTPNRAQSQAGTGGAVPLDAQIKAAEASGNPMQSIALKQAKYYAPK